ncbi:MAG: CBS domain-containing protein [Methanomassiliicoccales archaeon]|jgi:acetoin utilization protein AcuB
MGAKKMIPKMPVADIMSKNVLTISEDDTIGTALSIFEEKDYNSLPVVRDGMLVGMIAKLDLLKAISHADTRMHPGPLDLENEIVKDFMRSASVSIKPDDDLRSAAAYMVEFRLRALPVVKGGRVVGILSEGDIMDNLVSE